MTTRNALWNYDFTLKAEGITYEEVIKFLYTFGKKWKFQHEEGNGITKYEHYQGRVSFKMKIRLQVLIKKDLFGKEHKPHWSATQSKTKGFDYVMKEDTRIDGPWCDTDKPRYIPRQYRGKMETLRPFQKQIIDSAYHFDDRTINIILCPKGSIGKSVVASLCELYRRGIDLPVVNDAEKLIQSCCNICMKRGLRNPSPIFIDLPRAFNQEKMNGIFIAIEQIKKGKLFDMRYNYQEWWIDSPQIWVFTNLEEIDLNYLSQDRWKIWKVDRRTFEMKQVHQGSLALACNTKSSILKNPTLNNLTVGPIGPDSLSDCEVDSDF